MGGKLESARTCGKYGATGLGVAVGKYGLGRTDVVQTLGMFCGKPDQTEGCPQGATEIPEFANLYGSNRCQACVALHGSTDPLTGPVDREVANLPVARYNCHFYTLTFMNRYASPGVRRRAPVPYSRDRWDLVLGSWEHDVTSECLSDDDFAAYGYKKVMAGTVNPAQLRKGDIIAVFKTSVIAEGCRHAHSGIVIQDGDTVVTRQKPDGAICVTDMTWPEFRTFYAVGTRTRANVWRK